MATSKIQARLIRQLVAQGKPISDAYRISTSALQRSGNLKPNSTEPTAKGEARGNMTPALRAKLRAVKYAGKGTASDYVYDRATNRAHKR